MQDDLKHARQDAAAHQRERECALQRSTLLQKRERVREDVLEQGKELARCVVAEVGDVSEVLRQTVGSVMAQVEEARERERERVREEERMQASEKAWEEARGAIEREREEERLQEARKRERLLEEVAALGVERCRWREREREMEVEWERERGTLAVTCERERQMSAELKALLVAAQVKGEWGGGMAVAV